MSKENPYQIFRAERNPAVPRTHAAAKEDVRRLATLTVESGIGSHEEDILRAQKGDAPARARLINLVRVAIRNASQPEEHIDVSDYMPSFQRKEKSVIELNYGVSLTDSEIQQMAESIVARLLKKQFHENAIDSSSFSETDSEGSVEFVASKETAPLSALDVYREGLDEVLEDGVFLEGENIQTCMDYVTGAMRRDKDFSQRCAAEFPDDPNPLERGIETCETHFKQYQYANVLGQIHAMLKKTEDGKLETLGDGAIAYIVWSGVSKKDVGIVKKIWNAEGVTEQRVIEVAVKDVALEIAAREYARDAARLFKEGEGNLAAAVKKVFAQHGFPEEVGKKEKRKAAFQLRVTKRMMGILKKGADK